MQCINPKKYALTKGKDYKVIYEKDNVVTVVNDNGGAANYAKSLFAETVEVPIPAPVPVFSYVVDVTREDDSPFRVTLTTVNPNNTLTTYLSTDGTIISCGVCQLSGINDLSELIIDTLPENVRLDAISQIFQHIKDSVEGGTAIILVSTNISDNNTTIRNWLDNNCMFSSDEVTNPNSDNQIKVWGIEV